MKFPFGNPFTKQELSPTGDSKKPASGINPNPDVDPNLDPTTGKPKVAAKESDDPLLNFTKLWEDDVPDPNKPKQDLNAGYLPKIDSVKLNNFINGMDFTKDAKPEDLAAIVAGGEGAVKAVTNLINGAVRQSMLVGFHSNQRIVESGLATAKTRFLSEVPSHVKDTMIQDGLTSSNPLLSDPEYGPMVEGIRQQFQTKHPKATPKAIEGAVNKYFDNMYAKMTTKKTAESTIVDDNTAKLRKGDGTANWEDWAGDEIGSLFEVPADQNPAASVNTQNQQ